MIFTNARLIFPDKVAQGHLRVNNGVIAELSGHPIPPESREEVIDLNGLYLAPGFIDLHVHGALRRDTMEAKVEAFETICRFHATGGTTALALTTVTATTQEILDVIRAVEVFRESSAINGAQVLGVHIEGPYFSKEKAGAHRTDLIRNPQPHECAEFLAHASTITQMTLAPELPGALPLIDALRAHNIIASGGHSDAWDEEAHAAFVHGMRQVTHAFNCMSSTRRRGPYRTAGLLEYALSEPEILCELIADGRHVSPTLMRMLYMAKGADGICLVTDATAGTGLSDGAPFRLRDVKCVVRDGVGFTADGSALAGSTSTMIQVVANMVRLTGVPLVEAVRMASLNPACALGLDSGKGRLSVGADADLVAFSPDFKVSQTYVRGNRIFDHADNSSIPV